MNIPRFVTAIKLVNLIKGTYEPIEKDVIKSKVQNETTTGEIITKLIDYYKTRLLGKRPMFDKNGKRFPKRKNSHPIISKDIQ